MELAGFTIIDGERIPHDPNQLALADKWGQVIEIWHVPTDITIKFYAFINDYSDQFESDWQSEDVYGRMDPIMQFQGTKRTISLDWAVPSFSRLEARLNQRKCDVLFRLLYPMYDKQVSNAMTISTSPLFKLRFGNLIVDNSIAPGDGSGGGLGSAKETGLIGVISGFTYAPDFDQGMIAEKGDEVASMGLGSSTGLLFPKALKLSCEYTVLHANRPGTVALYGGTKTRDLVLPEYEGEFPPVDAFEADELEELSAAQLNQLFGFGTGLSSES